MVCKTCGGPAGLLDYHLGSAREYMRERQKALGGRTDPTGMVLHHLYEAVRVLEEDVNG